MKSTYVVLFSNQAASFCVYEKPVGFECVMIQFICSTRPFLTITLYKLVKYKCLKYTQICCHSKKLKIIETISQFTESFSHEPVCMAGQFLSHILRLCCLCYITRIILILEMFGCPVEPQVSKHNGKTSNYCKFYQTLTIPCELGIIYLLMPEKAWNKKIYEQQ